MSIDPPILPETAVYTSCYCEENIYLLAQTFLSTPEIADNWITWVVFISNEDKRVALFYQKAARNPELPVIWDYHVILILQPRRGDSEEVLGDDTHVKKEVTTAPSSPQRRLGRSAPSWVYDFDTQLPIPCPWKEYLEMTFMVDLLPEFESCFRVVPAEVYLRNFASDRSHMIVETSRESHPENMIAGIPSAVVTYSSPPPGYEPIFGEVAAEKGIKTNLMSGFVDMRSSGRFGEVLSRNRIVVRFGFV